MCWWFHWRSSSRSFRRCLLWWTPNFRRFRRSIRTVKMKSLCVWCRLRHRQFMTSTVQVRQADVCRCWSSCQSCLHCIVLFIMYRLMLNRYVRFMNILPSQSWVHQVPAILWQHWSRKWVWEFPILILAISIRLLMHFMLLRVQDGVLSVMHFQAVQMLWVRFLSILPRSFI